MRRECQIIAQGMDSFLAAAVNKRCAFLGSKEVSSKIICPAFTRATQ